MASNKDNARPTKSKSLPQQATGAAAITVAEHSDFDKIQSQCREPIIVLFGSCFCPFVQRVWIALEMKSYGVLYQYVELNPYDKTPELLAINPRGLVPAIRHDSWTGYESSVLMEYLEDIAPDPTGFGVCAVRDSGEWTSEESRTKLAQKRANARLWTDHINRKVIPGFYALLQAQELEKQRDKAIEFQQHLTTLINAADPTGPFFWGKFMGFVDVQIAPWIVRLRRVLTYYRDWPLPQEGTRWKAWVDAIEADPAVIATTSDDQLYIDNYLRYAENRPDNSEVSKAINEGRGLP